MNSDARQTLILEEVVKAIRQFFEAHNFHEVIVPMLHEAIPLEPNIYPFTTTWKTQDEEKNFYLPTSPERTLKLRLAQGIGNCFAIGNTLRNLENQGPKHHPEFLMLEWYRQHSTTYEVMQDTQALIVFIAHALATWQRKAFSQTMTYRGKTFPIDQEWPVLSFYELISKHIHVSYDEILQGEKLFSLMLERGYRVDNATYSELFDQLFLNEIEPHLPSTPLFLTDFPASMSPLCATKTDRRIADRFEVYLFGIEVGNGNAESSDTQHIKRVFTKEQKKRGQNYPIDQQFLHALETIAPKHCAGIGVGIDRLVMLYSDTTTIPSLLPSLDMQEAHSP